MIRYALSIVVATACIAGAQETRQATGVKVGEVSPTAATVWVRLTEKSARNDAGVVVAKPKKVKEKVKDKKEKPEVKAESDTGGAALPSGLKIADLKGACPGAAGKVRVTWSTKADLSDAKSTEWTAVGPATDFIHQFRLEGLTPNTNYHFASETASADGAAHAPLKGSFRTAPKSDEHADVTFTVITGQAHKDLDDPAGFLIYDGMLKVAPAFIVPTGDTVYYDNDDLLADTLPLARHHWHRIYSLPKVVRFHQSVPGFWEKDDHDVYQNDCWPGMRTKLMGEFTFEQGQKVFLEQVPAPAKPFRTVRWGKGLEVWLVEGRDFRSPNNKPDGPDKTIWGAEQKEWLKKSLLASDADWKILVSPTPIVGPDRTGKGDNHANAQFKHEGDEFREWAQKSGMKNFFVACGDRHWQYHSVHPTTGLHEFSCGPASDKHAGGSPGLNMEYHKFHRVKGGFLSIAVTRTAAGSSLVARWHDVDGKVEYEFKP